MTEWLIFAIMMNQSSACYGISGERILGADMAQVLPAFSAMPRDAAIGFSPAPGATRVLLYPELRRIGFKYGVDVPENARACFEWKLSRLKEDVIRAAIRGSLHAPDARVEILTMSQARIPEGKIEFPVTGLSISGGVDPKTPVLWRGYVLYAGSRKFAVWARVRVTSTMTRVVAMEALAPAKAIEKHQVRLETYDDFPLHSDVARDLDEVIARVPRRAIRANLPVMRADLAEPFLVQRGENVEVTVVSGATQLSLEATAETSGRQGDVIRLTNTSSGKQFRARVEGKDRALLVAGPRGLMAGIQ
jgi:flagella basal body P-ring formation protein FlgA